MNSGETDSHAKSHEGDVTLLPSGIAEGVDEGLGRSRGEAEVKPPNPMNIPPNPWAFGEFWLIDEFGVHRDLIDLLEPQLDTLLQEHKEVLKEAAESTEAEAVQDELYSLLYDEENRGEQFKNILFNSFFAVSFALFEHKWANIRSCGN